MSSRRLPTTEFADVDQADENGEALWPGGDALAALVHHEVYLRGDPVGRLVGGLREGHADPPQNGRLCSDGGADRWAEEARKARLARDCRGHIVWMRAPRSQRTEFLTPGEADDLKEVREKIARVLAGPKRSPCQGTLVPQRHWFLVRAAARPGTQCSGEGTTLRASGSRSGPAAWGAAARLAAGAASAEGWCWRYDFVQEARMAANGSGMRFCTITKNTPGTWQLTAKEGYSEAISSTGGRELWNREFLNLLEALRAQWGLTDDEGLGCVKLPEAEALERYPHLWFEEEPDLLSEVRPGTIGMPRGLARRLREAGPPPPPPLPNRLPYTVPYMQDKPWAKLLSRPAARGLTGTASMPMLFLRPDTAGTESSGGSMFG